MLEILVMYKFVFHLDSTTTTPELEELAHKGTKHSDTYRVFEYHLPPVVGGEYIQGYINTVQEKCENYKLIVIGEHRGHMEIYESENYDGDLAVNIVKG